MKAKIVVYEGPDRVGKATQSKMMVDFLREHGFKAERVEVPERNFLHKYIYMMLKNGVARKHPYFFQFVQMMNKLIFQVVSLPKLVRNNDYVVLDRWTPSAWVYGLADGLNRTYVETLLKLGKKADFTVVLVGKPQVTEMRDDYEKDSSLQSRVRNLYEVYAAQNDDTVLIQANQTRVEVFHQIHDALMSENVVPATENVT